MHTLRISEQDEKASCLISKGSNIFQIMSRAASFSSVGGSGPFFLGWQPRARRSDDGRVVSETVYLLLH